MPVHPTTTPCRQVSFDVGLQGKNFPDSQLITGRSKGWPSWIVLLWPSKVQCLGYKDVAHSIESCCAFTPSKVYSFTFQVKAQPREVFRLLEINRQKLNQWEKLWSPPLKAEQRVILGHLEKKFHYLLQYPLPYSIQTVKNSLSRLLLFMSHNVYKPDSKQEIWVAVFPCWAMCCHAATLAVLQTAQDTPWNYSRQLRLLGLKLAQFVLGLRRDFIPCLLLLLQICINLSLVIRT